MGGVLIGEEVYGLTYVADTTFPPYWRGEIVVGPSSCARSRRDACGVRFPSCSRWPPAQR